MKRDLLCVIVFFLIVYLKTTSADQCTFILDKYSMDSQDIPCENSTCQYHIKTNSSDPIKLEIDPNHYFQKYLIVWETFFDNGEEQKILKMNLTGSHSKLTFISGVNQSFIFEPGFPCTFSVPSFKYSRVKADQVPCNPILNIIGDEITTVQQGDAIDDTQMCPYRLKRKPSAQNSTETLYIVASGSYTQNSDLYSLTENEIRLERTKFIKVSNWSTYDIIATAFDSPSDENRRWSYTIQAVSSNETCSCEKNDYIIDSLNETKTIHSPGFPNFACPLSTCKTNVLFPVLSNAKIPTGAVSRVMVSLKSVFRDGINFTLTSKSLDFSFSERTYINISTSFLLNEDDLRVKYTSPNELTTDVKGHYEMNITRVLIQKGCNCSLFGEKAYKGDWQGVINIPAHCDLLFCQWNLSYKTRKQVNITLINVNKDDEVHIWNRDVMEVYMGDQFKYKRSMYLPDAGDAHIAFWRKSRGLNAKILLSWEAKYFHYHHHMCDFEYNITTTPMTILSHNYPSTFYGLEHCTYRLRAPENHTVEVYMEEVDIEINHDHLSFYDGSSKNSELIKELTGKNKDQAAFSTGNEMFVEYHSNIQGHGRGYHFNAFAVPNEDVTITQTGFKPHATNKTAATTTTTEKPKEHPSALFATVLIVLLLVAILVILGIGGVYVYRKRKNVPQPDEGISLVPLGTDSESTASASS